jgi:transposase-like protein
MPTSRAESLFKLPRWNEEDAREVLRALERSGQPVSVFASEHGLDPQRLYLWRRRLGASAERTTFQEVVVRAGGSNGDRFEVVLASGTTVRVPTGFDDDALVRLLDVLSRAGVC